MVKVENNNEFALKVYASIAGIPEGKVATYGDIAELAGYPRHARHVGKLLSQLPEGSKIPWYRVVNAKGEISLRGDNLTRQREKLLAEGISVSETGKLSLRLFRW